MRPIICQLATATALMIAGFTASAAESGDPYAAATMREAKETYARNKSDFLKTAEVIGFAAGCRVVGNEAMKIVWGLETAMRERFTLATGYAPPGYGTLWQDFDAAKRVGLAKAQNEGCQFWHENPDKVLELRRLARP